VVVGNGIATSFKQKAGWILAAVAMLMAVGFVLEPLGISKNLDTPTWCLYCTAANLAIMLLLYWIADVKGWKAWASIAKPAGENPLLAYLLHYAPFLVVPLMWLSASGTTGAWGVLKSVIATLMVLMVTAVLVRAGVKLRA
jgi:predicted acyltransferase